jgi:hypothetical protein
MPLAPAAVTPLDLSCVNRLGQDHRRDDEPVGDEIAVMNGDEVANELVAIDRPAPTPVRSCSFSGSPDCRFSAPTIEAIPRNATPGTETYFLPPQEPRQ